MGSKGKKVELHTVGITAICGVLLVLLLLLFVAGWYFQYAWEPGPMVDSATVVVEIPEGSSVRDIQKILVDRRVIHDDIRFLLMARLSGRAGRLQAGEFLLPTRALPGDIIHALSIAHSIEYSITIPEGLSIEETASRFAARGWCRAERFIALCHNAAFIASLGLEGAVSLEGFLYPARYSVPKSMRDEKKLIALMVGTFRNVWQELVAGIEPPPERNRIVTLASMVEKETSAGFERPIIAGVFFNRLKKGMRLQSDPTVVYGVKDFHGKITRAMLRNKTPYNTYVVNGLPAGPIANPGRAALKAVLFPAETSAFYFVAKGNGTHKFSRTLREHNNAVRKYLRR